MAALQLWNTDANWVPGRLNWAIFLCSCRLQIEKERKKTNPFISGTVNLIGPNPGLG